MRRCVWSTNIKNRCSIYIYIYIYTYIYDISSLRVKYKDSFSDPSRFTGCITRNAPPTWTNCSSNGKMTSYPEMNHTTMTTCHLIVYPCCWGGCSTMSVWLGLLDEDKDWLASPPLPILFFAILSITQPSSLVRKKKLVGNGIYLSPGWLDSYLYTARSSASHPGFDCRSPHKRHTESHTWRDPDTGNDVSDVGAIHRKKYLLYPELTQYQFCNPTSQQPVRMLT